jgi:hypothetical protein
MKNNAFKVSYKSPKKNIRNENIKQKSDYIYIVLVNILGVTFSRKNTRTVCI